MKRLLLLLLLCACKSPLDVGGKQYASTAQVLLGVQAYGEVEECTGLQGRVRLVEWWVADRLMLNGKELAGVQPNNDIIVSVRYAPLTWVWRHESVHHVLRIAKGGPDAEHTDPVWFTCKNDVRELQLQGVHID